ncbi:DUF2061 domain-containing protein [Methylomarinum vadi]|uniref:DUF2061 domain-containing protein n=1 Tax=Methylomarinum vadi TaxID=438855 RepID=UPI0004DFA13E|nr:DUF2061 domain-containing protein [Methylomarinum vadi]
MKEPNTNELHRRTLVKSLLWRLIGIVWTWIGAYLILLFIPPSRQSAALIATLIVVYHHSTRMIMYYVYERIWASIAWGRSTSPCPMTRKEKVLWAFGTVAALTLLFLLLLEIQPNIDEEKRSAQFFSPQSTTLPT